MKDFFLGAAHWKVFLATAGIPIIIQIIAQGASYSINPAINQSTLNPEEVLGFVKVFMLAYFGVLIFFLYAQFTWLWQVSTSFQVLLPEGESLNLRIFKMLFTLPLIAMVVMAYAFYNVFEMIQSQEFDFVSFGLIFLMATIMFPTVLYLMYVPAKTIKSAEAGAKLKFGEFAGEFFLVVFFFIGVFALQPRVNALYAKLKGEESSELED